MWKFIIMIILPVSAVQHWRTETVMGILERCNRDPGGENVGGESREEQKGNTMAF